MSMITAFLALLLQEAPAPQEEKKQDLTELSIEDLLQVEITSVSKKIQKLIETPSAVFVIRGDDIRRAGATSVPDALRMVPGVQVARIDSSKWAVSARGFNGRFANKLLVLIDGRSVYTPLFSGVFWDVQDTVLTDIDRIEVIRGPGGTTWGANAVNGVINIITKSAKETEGAFLVAKAGSEETGTSAARWGGSVGDAFHYRAWVKGRSVDAGYEGEDDWWTVRGGFRADWTLSDVDDLTFTGDIYRGKRRGIVTYPDLLSPTLATSYEDVDAVDGGHLQARWRRRLGDASELELQAYWDRADRSSDVYGAEVDVLDVAFQIRFPLAGHDLVTGGGYRLSADRFTPGPVTSIEDKHFAGHLFQVFLQDEITILPDTLRLTLGSKFEYNSLSQFEYMPSARLLWTPHERHAVWAAASRAVRTPSRGEADASLVLQAMPGLPPILTTFVGSDDFRSEDLIALELGYRVEPLDWMSADTAVFYNVYDHLLSGEPGAPSFNLSPIPHIDIFAGPENLQNARTYGTEVSLRVHPWERVRFTASYSFLRMNLDPEDGSAAGELAERNSPRHQAFLGVSADLPGDFDLTVSVRYVSTLRDVEAYVEFDARLAWRPLNNLEIALVGQNLARPHHREFAQNELGAGITDVERGAYLSVTWKW